jgi:hypothetical protein
MGHIFNCEFHRNFDFQDIGDQQGKKRECVDPCISCNGELKQILPPFQIIRRFGFSRDIGFAMHIDIHLFLGT